MSGTPQYECAFARTAKLRWRGFGVEGTGPYAVVNASLHYVALFSFRMFAEQYLNERTDSKYCTLFEIPPTYGGPSGQQALRVHADRVERDR